MGAPLESCHYLHSLYSQPAVFKLCDVKCFCFLCFLQALNDNFHLHWFRYLASIFCVLAFYSELIMFSATTKNIDLCCISVCSTQKCWKMFPSIWNETSIAILCLMNTLENNSDAFIPVLEHWLSNHWKASCISLIKERKKSQNESAHTVTTSIAFISHLLWEICEFKFKFWIHTHLLWFMSYIF